MSLLSIIVPIYKVEKYLHECIDSIICQTYTNLEIILVDDGSPDNCPQICDEYVKIDKRIVVIHRENGGLSAARNSGIDICKGDYICFVDSDDVLHPQYCEFLLKGIKEKNVEFCACISKPFFDEEVFDCSKPILSFTICTMKWQDYLYNNRMSVWNRIYKRNLFDKVRFKEGRIHEDIFFAADLMDSLLEKNVAVIEATLYFARQRADGICNAQTNSQTYSVDRIFAGEYLIEQGYHLGASMRSFCLKYAVLHPWSFVDKIYVNRNFKPNLPFLKKLQQLIRLYAKDYLGIDDIPPILKHRMIVFSRSRFLYGFNAYGRLLRVYLYRLFKKDPYKDGHGI